MNEPIRLRPATLQDAERLLQWRNDPSTRNASDNTAEVSREEHAAWLAGVLADPNRQLYVAEERGVPVGTVRADRAAGVWELSWTVAPGQRGHGVARHMVAELARRIADPIRAEVKSGRPASKRVAEHAGMTFERETAGVLHYRRAALK